MDSGTSTVASGSDDGGSDTAAAPVAVPARPALAAVPNYIRLIQLDDGSTFLCGICRRAQFSSFEEGCMHEVVCKMITQQRHALGHQNGATASASAASSNGSGGGGSFGFGPRGEDPHSRFVGSLPPLSLPPPPLFPSSSANVLPASEAGPGPGTMPVMLPFPLPAPPPIAATSISSAPSNNKTIVTAASTGSNAFAEVKEDNSSDPPRRNRPARKKKAAVESFVGKSEIETMSFSVSLVPPDADRGILSDYNYLLCQNIELFEEITTTTSTSGAKTSRTSTRIGLRCIHCSGCDRHAVGSTFYPSSINFISPALGNIGSRHLLGGKCPFVNAGIVDQLKACKLTTQAQTKEAGRTGLDAYCKSLAARCGIVGNSSRVIYHEQTNKDSRDVEELSEDAGVESSYRYVAEPASKKKRKRSKSSKKQSAAEVTSATTTMDDEDRDIKKPDEVTGAAKSSPVDSSKELLLEKENLAPNGSGSRSDETILVPEKRKVERFTGKPTLLDASSFVPGSVEYFWECKHCSSLPVPYRASGSVVFSAKAPSLEVVTGHLLKCQGLDALPIPRDAKISIGHGESLPPIRISFDNKQLKKRSKKIEKQRAAMAAGKPWPPLCKETGPFLPSGEVNPGVEKTRLAVKSDLELTTEFAHKTVTLLRKCYLTKTGGSRGGQTIGFPGLACSFCAGHSNERRFFYTSADMLRNSFAHIPSHIMSCQHAPVEVRRHLQSLKVLRNNHKATLGPGSHKRFIAQVWKRIHCRSPNLEDCHGYFSSSDDDDEIEESTSPKNAGGADVDAIDAKMPEEEKGLDQVSDKEEAKKNRSKRAGKPKPVSTRRSAALLAACSSRDSEDASSSYVDTELVNVADRHLTTDLFFLSLQLGCEIYNLGKADVERIGQSVVVGTPVIQCKFCNSDNVNVGRIFMPRSAHSLRSMMMAIANHLSSSCPSCPQHIKAQLHQVGGKLREEQEGKLKRGSGLKFAEKVYSRLMAQDKSERPEEDDDVTPLPPGASSVVLSGDETLISGYTHYTLLQMVPCILGESGQGSRSSFPLGTPGLACRHCSASNNARAFYFRNSEVFSNNYTHIPTHIQNCAFVPANVKTRLAEEKELHTRNRKNISKANQRAFFRTVWRRLQIFAKEAQQQQKRQRQPMSDVDGMKPFAALRDTEDAAGNGIGEAHVD